MIGEYRILDSFFTMWEKRLIDHCLNARRWMVVDYRRFPDRIAEVL